jgi:hypothetical protein
MTQYLSGPFYLKQIALYATRKSPCWRGPGRSFKMIHELGLFLNQDSHGRGNQDAVSYKGGV